MARIRINCRPMDPKHMEGRQVILNVEKVDVEKGEILCTLIAVSGDMSDGAIDIKPISAEWVTPTPKPQEGNYIYFDMLTLSELKWPK